MSEERSTHGTHITRSTPEATPEATEATDNGITSTRTLQSGKRIKRLVMNIDEDLHKALRREALEADMSLTSYVTSILEQRR